jgi:hypothetical protein
LVFFTVLTVCLPGGIGLCAETAPDPGPDLAPTVNPALIPVMASRHSPPVSPLNSRRLLGVIPDFGTVESTGPYTPLTPRQKWNLALKGTFDPYNLVNSAMTAAFSQDGNQTPKYGEGGVAYGKRFGAALADGASQCLLGAAVFSNLLHQDPRYFRMGPRAGILRRAFYSVSRLAVGRRDSGAATFNAAGVLGMTVGIAASNLYYPSASIRGSIMAERLTTSLTGVVVGDLMSEFVPDLEKKFLPKLIFWRKSASQN